MPKLERAQLIDLVTRLSEGQGTEEQQNQWIAALRESVSDPKISDYIFWDNSNPPLTPKQIIDKALAYQPIALGGPE